MTDPIILTLQLDEAAQGFFQRERERWFPPRLDQVPAHLTLFHKLPGEEQEAVMRTLAEVCAVQSPFTLEVTEPFALGKGVAYRLRSERLEGVRTALARGFARWLTPQDKQGFRAHVTIQNKVTPATAKACLAEVQRGFTPFAARAEGVQLWSYKGGPWGALGATAFGG